MTTNPDPGNEVAIAREIDHEADTAKAAIPAYLRRKVRRAPRGSTQLAFSDRTNSQPRKARSHD